MNDLFSDNVDEIEETKENDGVGDWIAVDSDPLMAPQESNKYGTLTIAGVDNAEFPNMQYVEIKEDTTIFPVNGPVAEESGGWLEMGVNKVVPETKFLANEQVGEPEVEWLCKAVKIRGDESPNAWEKTWERYCYERVKVGIGATASVETNEVVSKGGGAEDKGWPKSNMSTKLLFVERPGTCVSSKWSKKKKLAGNSWQITKMRNTFKHDRKSKTAWQIKDVLGPVSCYVSWHAMISRVQD